MRKINMMFILIIGTALSVGFWSLVLGSPFKRQQQPQIITLTLKVAEVEIVLKGLGKLPLEESGGVFFSVKNQAEKQLNPAPAIDTAAKKKEEPKPKKN